ncbi:MAG TPA: glucose-6-phosphate isomerase, partial [Bacteroidales bacterium]|nr:glucose-6-phosphate isomerase [Bacteroidales bacterium]
SEMQRITQIAKSFQQRAEVVVVIGIGGSYLGARAVIEALQGHFKDLHKNSDFPTVLFAGNNISEDYLFDLLQVLDNKEYGMVVISKSGTTTEPAIAFRILKGHCEKKYGKTAARERIVVITDSAKGALKQMATQENYETFVIPDNVGGRYSVLTPVGLLPIAIAGYDIRNLLRGAAEMRNNLLNNKKIGNNIAMQYATFRNYFYQNGKKVELMVAYEPRLYYLIEWYKQLFGESEGKDLKGIFPVGSIFSTDLHSLGQYIQEGERQLFETVISVEKSHHTVAIPYDEQNMDGLNYLQSKSLTEINHTAEIGTRMAHIDGGVPNLQILIPEICETTLGELIYFFEFSCALNGYLLSINPFNQPGVEAYKRNMFKLLGKE